MSEKKNISGMFGHHEGEDKPEPEIRGGNRPSDYIPEDNPPIYGLALTDEQLGIEQAEDGCPDDCGPECSGGDE